MSWSHSKTGLPKDVVESLSTPRNMQCIEPEQGFKTKALDLIQEVLLSYPAEQPVSLSCYGSQTTINSDPGKQINNLSITIAQKQPG
jgi:hypothetical protein